MLPSTVHRVPSNTAQSANLEIRKNTEKAIAHTVSRGQAAIDQRLRELDEEWDIERLLEANASVAALTFLTIGATVDRRANWLAAAVAGFLFQHAIQGWCPPMVVFRRMGVRTASEIDYERYALKALRGDFSHMISDSSHATEAAQAAYRAAHA